MQIMHYIKCNIMPNTTFALKCFSHLNEILRHGNIGVIVSKVHFPLAFSFSSSKQFSLMTEKLKPNSARVICPTG